MYLGTCEILWHFKSIQEEEDWAFFLKICDNSNRSCGLGAREILSPSFADGLTQCSKRSLPALNSVSLNRLQTQKLHENGRTGSLLTIEMKPPLGWARQLRNRTGKYGPAV